jgi:hypothetical protein
MDVDEDARLELVVSVEAVVSFSVLEIGVVTFPVLVSGAEVVSLGVPLVLGVVVVSLERLVLDAEDAEGVLLGARTPETSLRMPDIAEGNAVATPGMPESPSETDKDNPKSGGLVVLEPVGVEVVADVMAVSAVPCRGSSIRWLSMPSISGWSSCAPSRGFTA